VTYPRLDFAGLQYPVPDTAHPGTALPLRGVFPTADGRATLTPVRYLPPSELPDEDFPS